MQVSVGLTQTFPFLGGSADGVHGNMFATACQGLRSARPLARESPARGGLCLAAGICPGWVEGMVAVGQTVWEVHSSASLWRARARVVWSEST